MEEIIERLDKILFWLEFSGKKELKKFLLENLTEYQEKILYQKCDGLKGLDDLTKEVKIGRKTILDYWEKWVKLGIMKKSPVRGGERGVRLFDLIELGILQSKNE